MIKINQIWKYKSGERTCVVEHVAHEILPAIYYKLENSEDIDVCSEKQFLHMFYRVNMIEAGDWYTEQGVLKQAEVDACEQRLALINRISIKWVPKQDEWVCYEGLNFDGSNKYIVTQMTVDMAVNHEILPLQAIERLRSDWSKQDD